MIKQLATTFILTSLILVSTTTKAKADDINIGSSCSVIATSTITCTNIDTYSFNAFGTSTPFTGVLNGTWSDSSGIYTHLRGILNYPDDEQVWFTRYDGYTGFGYDPRYFLLIYHEGEQIFIINASHYSYNFSYVNIGYPLSGLTYENNPFSFGGTVTQSDTFDTMVYDLELNIPDTPDLRINIGTSSLPLGLSNYSNQPWSKTVTLPFVGNYTLRARLYDSVNATSSTWSNAITFSLASTTPVYLLSTSTDTSTSTILAVAQLEACSGLDIGCYIRNALKVLFIPTSISLNKFTGMANAIKTKPPFGYMQIFSDGLSGISTSSTPAFTLNIPTYLQDLIFTPLRTGLVWVLGLFLAIQAYKRLENLKL